MTAVVKRIRGRWSKPTPGKRQWFGKQSGARPELKCVDVSLSGTMDQSSATTTQLLNGVAAGTDFYNRVGRKIRMKSILVKGFVSLQSPGSGATASSEQYPVRVAIVYDEQPATGTNIAASTIFQGVDNTGASVVGPYVGLNLNNRDRFKILRDWTICLKPITNAGTTASYGDGMHAAQDFSFYKKLDLDAIFTDTSASNISTGSIYFIAYQQQAAQANGINGAYRIISRIRYEDS